MYRELHAINWSIIVLTKIAMNGGTYTPCSSIFTHEYISYQVGEISHEYPTSIPFKCLNIYIYIYTYIYIYVYIYICMHCIWIWICILYVHIYIYTAYVCLHIHHSIPTMVFRSGDFEPWPEGLRTHQQRLHGHAFARSPGDMAMIEEGILENHKKTIGKWWFNGGWMGFNQQNGGFNGMYPLVNKQRAIEKCHRNSEFSH